MENIKGYKKGKEIIIYGNVHHLFGIRRTKMGRIFFDMKQDSFVFRPVRGLTNYTYREMKTITNIIEKITKENEKWMKKQSTKH